MTSHVKSYVVRRGGKEYRYSYLRPPKRLKVGKNPIRLLSGDPVAEAAAYIARLTSESEQRRRACLAEHAASLVSAARKRAKSKNVPFGIDEAYVIALIEEQGYCCAVTGMPFDLHKSGARKNPRRLPMRPSLDRIEPPIGYVRGNIRIVWTAANIALNEWGEDILRLVAEGFLRTKPHLETD